MPLGELIIEQGLLLREQGALVLQLDGGGRWRLDAPSRARRLLGQRVSVEATRSGYDLLDVHLMLPAGTNTGKAIRSRPGRYAIELSAYSALAALLLVVGW